MTAPRTAVLFRQPSKSSVTNVYLLPFSLGVWKATALSSLLALLMFIVQTQWWNSHSDNHKQNTAGDHINVMDCMTFVIGALCQQGEDRGF